MSLRLEHTALSVTNLDRSIAFYTEHMGFTFVRIIDCLPQGRLGEVVGLPGCAARLAFLQSGDNLLELFEYLNPRGKTLPRERTQADHGLTHLGFRTDDIHADYQRLRKAGVEFYREPIEYRAGVWVAYFYGPDGETCELRQLTDVVTPGSK
jgi:lactoylglutathione lyase